jgi:hypothetical protein
VWPCTLKLDEEMSKHASLGSAGFSSAFNTVCWRW